MKYESRKEFENIYMPVGFTALREFIINCVSHI